MPLHDSVIISLLEVMRGAIECGDWEVDGRCDPHAALARARAYLKQQGYVYRPAEDVWEKEE